MSDFESTLVMAVASVRSACRHLSCHLAAAWKWAGRWWDEVRDRHQRLMDTDPRYPVALATGGTAAVRVLISNPAVANALGVLLADLLGVPERPEPSSRDKWLPAPSWRDYDSDDRPWSTEWRERD